MASPLTVRAYRRSLGRSQIQAPVSVLARALSEGVRIGSTATVTRTGALTGFFVATTGSNGAAGTEAAPWQTLQYAMGRTDVVVPGTTIYLRGGTYNQRLRSNAGTLAVGDSWDEAITVKAYPSETVIFQPSSGDTVFEFSHSYVQYLIFDGLILDGSDLTGAPYDGTSHNWIFLLLLDVNHLRFTNGEIRHSPGTGVSTYGGAGGTYSSYTEILNSWIYDTVSHAIYLGSSDSLVDNCVLEPGGIGCQFYSNETGGHPWNNIIRNCTIRGAGALFSSSIDAWGLDHLIYNNVVVDAIGDGIVVGSTGTGTYFNTVSGCSNYGIHLKSGATGAVTKNNIAWNNSTNLQNDGGTTPTNNVTANPSFVGGGDYHLTAGSTNCHGAGVAIGGITTDKDGDTRNDPPDVGAYEYP